MLQTDHERVMHRLLTRNFDDGGSDLRVKGAGMYALPHHRRVPGGLGYLRRPLPCAGLPKRPGWVDPSCRLLIGGEAATQPLKVRLLHHGSLILGVIDPRSWH